ncbi:Geranylgeranyl transferase type-2 subunit alpha [Aphelenchoides bicaudatus]|nr:Geranylgeranyl transferase type-2 subunit alpha [Aphelenchoides bicaudatus]
MHGVKKTPASEAQLATYRKERDQKLQIYLEIRNRIFEKREKNEYDEEMLDQTAALLKKNPDVYTFWNIRRDVFSILTQKKEDETDEQYKDRLKSMYDDELKLTYKGIEANPKSYSAWYHRGWVLQQHPEPDLRAELALCEKSLSFVDCRNFHCWDHRRIVAKMAGLDANEELEFSNRLIKLNPSNYSAWHYRGTLFQKMHKEEGKNPERLLEDKVVADELETVKNVCAYNSEDQTAWTYCRWLCEALCTKVENKTVIVHAAKKSANSVSLTFSSAINSDEVQEFVNFKDNQCVLEKVSKFGAPAHKYSVVHKWNLISGADNLDGLLLRLGDTDSKLPDDGAFFNVEYLQKFYSFGSKCETEEARRALAGVVEMCEGLMQEEEDIPWEVLMLSRMLPLLEGHNAEVAERVHDLLDKTIKLDPQRTQVYRAMQQRIERAKSLQAQGNENPQALYDFFLVSKSLD